jgi:RNA polymerase sigma factor (sigma-70 family)
MEDPPGPRRFTTTRWSLVSQARYDEAGTTLAREALGELCRVYWYPLYAFVRSRGYSADDAQDLTQAFFAKILETDGLASADRGRGRFRSYLLGAMKHFLSNEWQRAKAEKRGGQVRFIDWDPAAVETRYVEAARLEEDPERLFDREWALESVGSALRKLRREMSKAGKTVSFDALEGTLTGDSPPLREIAARLNMSEGAVKVAVHRLRRRYRELLRATIAETLGDAADLDDEMRYLAAVLRGR